MALNTPLVVEGIIHLVGVSSSTPNATVYVQIVGVSLADAPSIVVAEKVIPDFQIDIDGPAEIRFSISTSNLNRRANYALIAHIDVNGSGEITQGDYLTMENFPVSPVGSRVWIPDVAARLVK
jgi:hypothetical protein